VDYADRLRTLSRQDLEELLARRSETFVLAGRSRVGYADLAGLLAQPYGTRRAIESLDRFHAQVLQLACVGGGRLEPGFAEQQGLDPGLLPQAAAELARWGLGFAVGRALEVPRCVLAAVTDPGRLGPPLGGLLDGQRLEEVRAMAAALGLVPLQRRKAELIERVVERMGDESFVREMVAGAPHRAALILEALRSGGGSRSWTDLAREVPTIFTDRGSMYSLRPAADGIPWLRLRALVLGIEWDQRLVVPAEVELALRGTVFPTWEPAPPPLELAALESDRHPVELVSEVAWLLDLWGRAPVSLLQSGDLGARECQRAAKTLGLPPTAVRFLASLVVWAGLVAVEEPPPVRARGRGRAPRRPPEPQPGRLVVVDEAAGQWRAMDTAQRWAALARPWWDAATQADEPTGLVLRELAALPEGRGALLPGLARRLAWRHPSQLPDADEAAAILLSTVATLHRLGVGAGPAGPVAGLSQLGRAILRGHPPERLAALFPAAESSCTVQADLRVIVAGPPDPALAAGLARMADLETSSPARVYRLSEGSLRRAIDDGMSAAEMAAFLSTRCRTGVPQNVAALIEDVGRRHGRLRVGTAALYLQADDPALLAEVAANRRLRGLRVTLLAPTVAVIQGADEAAALEALRRAGYMPGLDRMTAEAAHPAARRRRAAPPRAAPTPDLTAAERRELAARLLERPESAATRPPRELGEDELLSGITVSGRGDVERLMRLAVRAGRVVEIEYRNQQSGSISTRVIEPRLAGDGTVVGWCRLRRDDRVFAFEGVSWARATGELIEHVGLGVEDR
jgi:Helicase conserved C-terminal domain